MIWDDKEVEKLVGAFPNRDLMDTMKDSEGYSWGNQGIKWSAHIDSMTEEIVMRATIPNRSYLSVGFGPNMRGTDMIVWRWKDSEVEVDNLFSSGYSKPPSDGTKFLKTTIEDSADRMFKTFTTRRALDTGNKNDFVVQPDKQMVMCYAILTGSGDFIQHKKQDIFSIMLSSSGTST